MTRREDVCGAIRASGVVAIVRMKDGARVLESARALADGGVTVLEVTMTVPGAVELIAELARTLPADVTLGAGTVLDVASAERVFDAGASFIVSPVLIPQLIEAAHRRDAAVLPGCYTPTEIFTAEREGADFIKLFPATALGPQFLRDLRAPLPNLPLVPTGGVNAENAREWIAAGAVALGVGSALLDPAAIAAGRYEVLRERAAQLIAAVRAARAA